MCRLFCLLTLLGCLLLPHAAAPVMATDTTTEPPLATPAMVADWSAVEAAARGGTVRFYMYSGWSHTNEWVDGYVATELKARYDITLERVPMDASAFMNKLLAEKAAGKQEGSIDLLWINGENFKNAMDAGLLYGPFAQQLPNFQRHVDPAGVAFDFGKPTNGYEVPYGRAQFVFEYDSARMAEPPRTFAALAEWIKAHPGRFTYPQPPDFTGSAFIRQVFYAITGGHTQYMAGYSPQLFEANAPRLWAWLNGIKPGLWQQGRTYPKDPAAMDTLFARGEIDFSMSYHPCHAQSQILAGAFPATVRTFIMEDGSLYNTHFTAIPANSPNKPAAMVAANFLLSPEAQLSKFDPANWGDYPAIDLNTLDQATRARFQAVDLGPATLPPDVLAAKAVPEIPSAWLEVLEKGWDQKVLR
ncbi:ABC transporter substrate-binding protein [Megalodesulfovibrio paquesii]